MDFRPSIKGSPRLMDARIFRPQPMGLKEDLLTLTLEERLTYDAEENLFFVNFEGFAVKTAQDVQEIKDAVEKIVAPLSERVYTIVNYDNFTIYFGLKKGVTSYTLVANNVPVNARIIGANAHESHFVFDILHKNTSEIQPTYLISRKWNVRAEKKRLDALK